MQLFSEASYFILYTAACSPASLKRFLFTETVQMTLGKDDGENIKQKHEAISFMDRVVPSTGDTPGRELIKEPGPARTRQTLGTPR